MINGNIEGIRASWLKELEALYELQTDPDVFLSAELTAALADFTARMNREISVYISRSGEVMDVSVGDSSTAPLARVSTRRSLDRLCGVRCIHTHPSGDPTLSGVDIQSLRSLKLDAMAALGVNESGKPTALCVAFLDAPDEHGQFPVRLLPPYLPTRLPQKALTEQIMDADARITAAAPALQKGKERAIVVGLADSPDDPSLLELRRLAETAGALVVQSVNQNRNRVDTATYIGSGKAEDLALLVQELDADLVIMDDELSGAQVRNLEALIPCRILDRTALILDIFAMRAQSREGKLQVELAQLKYRLPRLTGLGTVLSRLGGGIGTRGPGETKLEVDRRRVRKRITDIQRELGELTKQRAMLRARRARNEVPVVALVGYTNAGKSTLLNTITGAQVLAEDKLFATLDPVSRRVKLPGGLEILLVDTVGFINKLPHDLVNAFRSTLEEALYADLLVLVEDVTDPSFLMQRDVVSQVLSELGAGDKPVLHALNKVDLLEKSPAPKEDHFPISALDDSGLTALLDAVEQCLTKLYKPLTLLVPYARGDVAAFLHKNGQVDGEEYAETGTRFTVRLSAADAQRAQSMLEGQKS